MIALSEKAVSRPRRFSAAPSFDPTSRGMENPNVGNGQQLTIDPDIQNVLPSAPSSAALKEIVRQTGATFPIFVWKGKGIIVDGIRTYQVYQQ